MLRLRDSIIKMGEELEKAAESEAREKESSRYYQRRMEDMKAEMDELVQRELESSRRRVELVRGCCPPRLAQPWGLGGVCCSRSPPCNLPIGLKVPEKWCSALFFVCAVFGDGAGWFAVHCQLCKMLSSCTGHSCSFWFYCRTAAVPCAPLAPGICPVLLPAPTCPNPACGARA